LSFQTFRSQLKLKEQAKCITKRYRLQKRRSYNRLRNLYGYSFCLVVALPVKHRN